MEFQEQIAVAVVDWLRDELTKPTFHWLRIYFRAVGAIEGHPVHEIEFNTNRRFCDADVKCSLILASDKIMFIRVRPRVNNDCVDCVLDYADPKLFDKLLLLINRMPSMG